MVTNCPKCGLPRFAGVGGYAGPQCTCLVTNFAVVDPVVRQQQEIESLRQQLAAALAAIKVKDAFIERVAKQTPEKPDYWSSCSQCGYNSSEAEDVLAATTDLDGLILCHAEPFCHLTQTSSDRNPPHGWSVTFGSGEVQLYRAWETK